MVKSGDRNETMKSDPNKILLSISNQIHGCITMNNWIPLMELALPIEISKNKGIPCLWECGGSKGTSGVALIVALADGSAPRAMFASTISSNYNNRHALIPINDGDAIIIATQRQGQAHVLVYRIEEITIVDTEIPIRNSDQVETKQQAIAKLKLNIIWDKIANNLTQYSKDLNKDNMLIPIKVCAKKATINNCRKAMYIQNFRYIANADKQYNIDNIDDSGCHYYYSANASQMLEYILNTALSDLAVNSTFESKPTILTQQSLIPSKEAYEICKETDPAAVTAANQIEVNSSENMIKLKMIVFDINNNLSYKLMLFLNDKQYNTSGRPIFSKSFDRMVSILNKEKVHNLYLSYVGN